jgi:hypothetical protein
MSTIDGEELYEDDDMVYHSRINLANGLDSSQEFQKYCLKCTICYRSYNTINRIPYVIVGCGHSICSECLGKIDSCPICRNEIDDTVINWAINSELKSNNLPTHSPFYKIFIDFKKEIETDYLRYPETEDDVEDINLTTSQRKLINKIKFRLKDIEIIDHMFDNLLIPNWIKVKIKQTTMQITGYKTRLEYFGLQDLEDQLPFCP